MNDLDPDLDPRLCCEFHHDRRATHLAPRHKGGDVDVPVEWTPICGDHLANWYGQDEPDFATPFDERLPIFSLTGLLELDAIIDEVRERRDDYLGALEALVISPTKED